MQICSISAVIYWTSLVSIERGFMWGITQKKGVQLLFGGKKNERDDSGIEGNSVMIRRSVFSPHLAIFSYALSQGVGRILRGKNKINPNTRPLFLIYLPQRKTISLYTKLVQYITVHALHMCMFIWNYADSRNRLRLIIVSLFTIQNHSLHIIIRLALLNVINYKMLEFTNEWKSFKLTKYHDALYCY